MLQKQAERKNKVRKHSLLIFYFWHNCTSTIVPKINTKAVNVYCKMHVIRLHNFDLKYLKLWPQIPRKVTVTSYRCLCRFRSVWGRRIRRWNQNRNL